MPDFLKNGISMVLLSYDEEKNLRLLIPQIKKKLDECGEPYEIIVVDSKESIDNTSGVCEENGVRYVIQEETGFADAFCAGIRFAQYQKFFIMDSDGSHNPEYIPDIYHIFMSENADVAIGSRYMEGGVTNDTLISQFISRSLNMIYGVVIGIPAKDMSTDFRLYHTCSLKEVEPELISVHFDVVEEVLLRLKIKKSSQGKKIKVVETPIIFDDRMFGNSKRLLFAFSIAYITSIFRLSALRLKATFKKHNN